MSAKDFAPRRCGQRGVTLIELIVFIVVVSVGLAGVLSVFNVVVRASADPLLSKQALAAGESLLEEILLKNFCDPDLTPPTCTPSVEASRNLFDDVQDFDTAGAFQNAADITGATVFSPASAFQTRVAVTQPVLAGSAGSGIAAGDVFQVDVTVRGPDSVDYVLTGYRYRYE